LANRSPFTRTGLHQAMMMTQAGTETYCDKNDMLQRGIRHMKLTIRPLENIPEVLFPFSH
jgi:hypothetical protein